jgi:hypothetical protein
MARGNGSQIRHVTRNDRADSAREGEEIGRSAFRLGLLRKKLNLRETAGSGNKPLHCRRDSGGCRHVNLALTLGETDA